MQREYEIVDIDFWEKDAVLVVEGQRYYFQFDAGWPTLKDAIEFFIKDGREEDILR